MAKASDNVFPKVLFSEETAPATPAAGTAVVYVDTSDGKIKKKDDAGTVVDLEAAGGSSAYVGARISDLAGADQAISATTTTAVTFDTEDFDSDGFANLGSSTTRLTIPTDMGGLYLIGGTVQFGEGIDQYAILQIRKNGSTVLGQQTADIGSSIQQRSTVTAMDVAVATDYYELTVYTEGGQDIDHVAAGPYFWIARLGT